MIVLDTHIWLWWVNGCETELNQNRLTAIQNADEVAISAISCFEVAWLSQHKRIELSLPLGLWFEKALNASGIKMVALTPEIASIAVALPEHHRDPQDRIIIATALQHNAELMSSDSKFPLYNELKDRLI